MKNSNLSLISIVTMVILSGITHAYELGPKAIMGFGFIAVFLACLNLLSRKSSKIVHFVYGLFNVLLIIGLGLFSGFWNHGFKVLLAYLHNGYLSPVMQRMFATPKIGSNLYETTGILTFIASMFAANYLYKWAKELYSNE